jgi:molybdate transport system substrate-binding protein
MPGRESKASVRIPELRRRGYDPGVSPNRTAVLLAAALALAAGLPGSAGALRAEGPREVRVAAAADLQFALDALLAATAGEIPGVRPVVTYGSSGGFFAQIENGAPFDLYLSADAEYPRRFKEKGLADGEVFLYAVGRIALWVPNGSKLDIGSLGVRALLDPSVRKVAIANPRHAPYGRAAEAAMRSLGVYEAVRAKLVLGENVAQAAQFVQSGAADAGVVALSLALAPQMRSVGRYVELPLASYPRMDQGGVILRGARDPGAARSLRDALLGPRGREVLRGYGFFLPDP